MTALEAADDRRRAAWRELVRMAAAQLPDDALCANMAETLREHAGGRPGKRNQQVEDER